MLIDKKIVEKTFFYDIKLLTGHAVIA